MEGKVKIYLVTDGSYSDCHVCGVYTTLEKAERAQALMVADSIEEFDLDDVPDAPPGMVRWGVQMHQNGDTNYVRQVSAADEYRREDRYYGPNQLFSGGRMPFWDFFIWAEDEDGAIKIANERRIKLIATGQWGPG